MFDALFTFQFAWICLLIIFFSTAAAFFCNHLHQQLMYISLAEWLMEHVYCPVIKVFLLIIMAFLLFPLIVLNTRYGQLFSLFLQPDFLISMVNVLFFSSLFFSFLPLLKQPAVAMPVLTCMATALVFLHQVAYPAELDISLFPALGTFAKIIVLMILIYLVNSRLNRIISQWIDQRFIITGSNNLVADSNNLIVQIPVVLAYGQGLALQIPSS